MTSEKNKAAGIICAGVLLLLLGFGFSTFGQPDRHMPDAQPPKPDQQVVPQKQSQDQQHQPQVKAPQQKQQTQIKAPQQQRQQQARAPQQGQQHQPKAARAPQFGQQRQQQAKAPRQGQYQMQTKTPRQGMPHQTWKQANVQHRQEQPQQHAGRSPQAQPVQQSQVRGVWQQHRAHDWTADHRTWQDRGGYHDYRIPQDNFRARFGRNHRFRISSFALMLDGEYPYFEDNGYRFTVLDPWPESWSDNWYDNDDVYIDIYHDGYYLYNRRHPGIGLAISISL